MDATPSKASKHKRRITPWPALFAAALLALACASVPRQAQVTGAEPQAAPTAAPRQQFALLIDASSSGSRLHVFQWQPATAGRLPRIAAAPVPRQTGEPAWQLAIDGGLSDYAGEPDRAGESLDPLLAFAAETLAAVGADPAATPLYLKATAGMRLVPEPGRSAIMEDVRARLAASPFRLEGAEIISGEQEGLFGWLSVNYQLGLLGRGAFPTVGALDLGGASTQITFLPVDFPESGEVALELAGTTYRVYSHSYLGFGQDEARRAVAEPACYPRGYPIPDGTEGIGDGTLGAGDFGACQAAIEAFLTRPCAASRCSLMGVYQPPLYGDFFAFSVYGYVGRFFGLDQNLSLPELKLRGAEYCATDWQRILAERPDERGRKYLPGYCFSAAYVATLLTEGFGFPLTTDRLLTPRAVQGSEVSWVLGAFLYELAASAE
jgi:apyrase